MSAEEVRINLTSSADTSGVDKMGAAVGGISGGAEKAAVGLGAAGKSSRELGQELGRSVEVGSQSIGLFQNIATASQGGAAGMAAAARAGIGFGQMLKGLLIGAGPVGIVLAGVGVAAGALVAAFSKPKGSVDDLAAAFKAAKTAADKFDDAKFEGIKATMAQLRTELGETLKAFDAIAEANERIAKSADDAARAELEASVSGRRISREQADAALKSIDARGAARGIKNTADRTAFEASETDRQLARARSFAAQPEAEMDYYRAEADKIRARESAARSAEAERAAAERALLSLPADRSYDQWKSASDRAATARASAEATRLAAGADSAKGSGRNAEETYAEFVADSLKKSEDVWKAANAGVVELAKQSKALAEKMQREQETRAEIDRINRESKAKQDSSRNPLTAEQEAKERARLSGLNPDQLRNLIAGGAKFASPALLQERLDEINAANPRSKPITYGLPVPGTAPVPQIPGSGGTIQRGGETFRAGAGGLEKVADALDGATQATKDAPTGEAPAKSAEELKKAIENQNTARAAADAAIAASLGAGAATAAEQGAAIQQLVQMAISTQQQLREVRAQVASSRQRIAA